MLHFQQFRYMMKELSEDERNALQVIGKRLRELRIEKGYSSYDLFTWEHKLPRATYAQMERGNNFTLATLMRVLKVHGLTLEEFFRGAKV